jgi:hypothetical protein
VRNFLFVGYQTEITNESVQGGLNSGREINRKHIYPLYVKFSLYFENSRLGGKQNFGIHPKSLMCVCVCVRVWNFYLYTGLFKN